MGATGTRPWDGLYGAEELEIRRAGGYGSRGGIGDRPAVLVIDTVRSFTGEKGEDHRTSIAKWRGACGPVAWEAIPHLRRLIGAGRERGFPVIFTRATPLPAELRTAQRRKNARATHEAPELVARGREFPDEIAPLPGEIVIEKTKPSVFFQTPLLSHLQSLGVDHLLVGGTTTSGCVRASIYDAFSYNLGVTVVEECVFDRFPTSHKAALFDMDAKYADVVPIAEVLRELDERFPARRLATSGTALP